MDPLTAFVVFMVHFAFVYSVSYSLQYWNTSVLHQLQALVAFGKEKKQLHLQAESSDRTTILSWLVWFLRILYNLYHSIFALSMFFFWWFYSETYLAGPTE